MPTSEPTASDAGSSSQRSSFAFESVDIAQVVLGIASSMDSPFCGLLQDCGVTVSITPDQASIVDFNRVLLIAAEATCSCVDSLISIQDSGFAMPIVICEAENPPCLTAHQLRLRTHCVLECPYSARDVCDAIRIARDDACSRVAFQQRQAHLLSLLTALDAVSRLLLPKVLSGCSNKQAAHDLGCSVRSVEAKRHEILRHFETSTFIELGRELASHGLDTTSTAVRSEKCGNPQL